MVCKRHKSAAADETLCRESNTHYFNPSTLKIDLKLFTKHLCEKDECADFDLNPSFLEESSCSENQFTSAFKHGSDADSEGRHAEKSVKDCAIK